MKLTKTKLKQIIREEIQKLSEAQVQGREKYKGLKYKIYYRAPKGYYAIGEGEAKKQIALNYFGSYDSAKEHAEIELEGYLRFTLHN